MRNFYLKHEKIINFALTFLLIVVCGAVSYLTTYHNPMWIIFGIFGVPGILFLLAKCDNVSFEEENKNE